MKSLLLFVFSFLYFFSWGQAPGELSRLVLDTALAPFYHGVASGDPLTDRVMIWTRVTTQDSGTLSLTWQVATDTLFANVIQSGITSTNAGRDYTVKVDVPGLQPATYYYYQFNYQGRKSLIGRTKTAPSGDNDHIRFAVVSCADYEAGYYNAYEHITYRNDFDAVLHLGDYIYEYETGGLPNSTRTTDPLNEIITLSDYRARYSHYRLDPQLRGLHQQYPFITTWDDHETANNSWYGGAQNHTPSTEGDWFVRKANGKKAYFEWLPVRESTVDSNRIYRKFQYGDLADVIVLDTRLEGRDQQNGTNDQDTNRTIMGHAQYNWFVGNLHDTTSEWKIVAQQVMMAPLGIGSFNFNEDQWDGYPAERTRLFNEVLNNNVQNFVVLTGDIHTSWANDLPGPNYNTFTGAGSVGVEFVTTSVTTANLDVVGPLVSLLGAIPPAIFFPHVKWANLPAHGYIMVDVTKTKTQSDWYFVNTLDSVDPRANLASSWYVNAGERHLRQANNAASGLTNQAALAPLTVTNPPLATSNIQSDLIIVGSYPNPFWNKFIIQYFSASENDPVHISLIDLSGKLVYKKVVSPNTGINYFQVTAPELPAGDYLLLMQTEKASYHKNIIKID